MIKVGVIGLGTMGTTHLDVYAKRSDVKVVAISDERPDRLAGRVRSGGNISGQAQGQFDFASARQYADGMELVNDPEIDLVDICVPTPNHVTYAKAVLLAGKHLLLEKPVGRHSDEVADLVALADSAPGFSMVAHCIRFWPEWVWLKEAIQEGRYGRVLGATFRRVASHPGGSFYSDGAQSGGAVLDMHIHDTDFIHYCFGVPDAVTTVGYSTVTTELDHLVTHYHYDDVPLVVAEGGWAMAQGFGFRMQYTVNFERATVAYDMDRADPLVLWQAGQSPVAVKTPAGMGYEHEIAYLLECIQENRRPTVSTVKTAARTLDIIEAEIRSARTGQRESIRAPKQGRVSVG